VQFLAKWFYPMKKPTLHARENTDTDKAQRADVPPTTGYTLVVDGQFKTEFANKVAAKEGATQLLAKNPRLKVEIYDSSSKYLTCSPETPPVLS
jgi:hypothetical protein